MSEGQARGGGIDGGAAIGGMLLIVLILGGLFGTGALLNSCGAADKAAADMVRAETAQEVARSWAAREAAAQSHQFFLENVPVMLLIAAGAVVVGLLAFTLWRHVEAENYRREMMAIHGPPPRQQQALPPPQIIVVQLPDQGRREMWRELEALRTRQNQEVVIYRDRQ